MVAISVNLNKVALLRNARAGDVPDLAAMCRLCLEHGADGITVHPRPDQRHIRTADVAALATAVAPAGAEFNMEGNPFAAARPAWPGFVPLVLEARPDQCTLVPDSDDQTTSDHGWNLEAEGAALRPVIAALREAGIRVSLFMEPEPEAMAAAAAVGADRIEIYTEAYARAAARRDDDGIASALEAIRRSAEAAAAHGLGVNAGHDLNLHNLPPLVAATPQLLEVSIGHALTADALRFGFPAAIAKYRAAMAQNGGV